MDLSPFGAQPRALSPTVPPTVEVIYAAAYWLLEQELPEKAAKVFRVMLHTAPGDERGWLGLGQCHERVGQHRVALELYGAGSVAASPSPRCEIARGRALRVLDRDDEADDAFDRAMTLADARDDEALFATARGEKAGTP